MMSDETQARSINMNLDWSQKPSDPKGLKQDCPNLGLQVKIWEAPISWVTLILLHRCAHIIFKEMWCCSRMVSATEKWDGFLVFSRLETYEECHSFNCLSNYTHHHKSIRPDNQKKHISHVTRHLLTLWELIISLFEQMDILINTTFWELNFEFLMHIPNFELRDKRAFENNRWLHQLCGQI